MGMRRGRGRSMGMRRGRGRSMGMRRGRGRSTGMRRGRDQADVEAQTCAGGRPVFRQACELFVKNAEFTGNGLQSRVLLCYNKLAGGWRVGVPASGHGISPPYRRHTDKTSANGKAEVFCGCFFGRIVIYYKSEGMAFGRLHQESAKLTAERCVGI